MKRLIIALTIIAALIAAGIGTSVLITSDLNNRLAAAYERGCEEGQSQGYLEGLQDGSSVGYQEGSRVGYEKGNWRAYSGSYGEGFYFVYNPTYDEVQEILVEGEKSSAKGIHDYAETSGIRVAYVRCQIARKAAEGMVYLYELVAFETVDNGFIIIEPWSHREVKVAVGKGYNELNGFPTSPYDDTITEVTVVW